MTLRTILVAASGGTASGGAIELGCRLARRFNAHIEGFHAKPDPFELIRNDAAFAASFTEPFLEKFIADTNAEAAKAKAEFSVALNRHGMDLSWRASQGPSGQAGASAAWREETGNGPSLVARRARFFDLIVLGRSERVIRNPHSDTVEQTLIHSGRSVLLAPANAPSEVGERIAIGWNGSAEAVRAMSAALPFLAAARQTTVISIGERHQASVGMVIDYLAWHDVKATHVSVPIRRGIGTGEQLLSSAREADADLLVMGGYSHAPWREDLFGGATHDIVGHCVFPVLLTH